MSTTEFNESYIGRRDDILALVPEEATRVLDIGCSVGALGEQIKQRGCAEVVGIELDPAMAEIAKSKLDRVHVVDVEQMDFYELLKTGCFDCIILGDVLEHLRDPWAVLSATQGLLSNDGVVVASVPNVRHYSTIVSLVSGDWPYRDRGIHDKTHLRFFTLASMCEMFTQAGLQIDQLLRKCRILERPHKINRYSRFLSIGPLREFLTFQYLVSAKSWTDDTS